MAVICPQCNTKNRSVAKFCIECISALPTTFADDQFARHTVASSLFGFARSAATTESAANHSTLDPVAAAAAPSSKGLWVSIAGLSIALIIGAAGWLVAGAGGWYFYSAGKAQVHPVRTGPPAEAQAPVVPPVASTPVRDEPALDASTPPATAPQRTAKAPDRPQTASTQPGEACRGLNFVASARCMAAQCLRAQFKAHAQCEAVRRQQRLEEGKRNPAAP